MDRYRSNPKKLIKNLCVLCTYKFLFEYNREKYTNKINDKEKEVNGEIYNYIPTDLVLIIFVRKYL